MKCVIWKYQLVSGMNRVSMPEQSRPLYVAAQHGKPTLWAQVDPTAPRRTRLIKAEMTGFDFSIAGEGSRAVAHYIGTLLLEGDNFVLHVYDHGDEQ